MPVAARSAIAMLASLGIAAAAGAVTLTVTPDKAVYDIGEVVTLTVVGDPVGESDFGIFGRLELSRPLTTPISATQTQHTTPGVGGWGVGPLLQSPHWSEAFNQITGPSTLPLPASELQVATIELCAARLGDVDVAWTLHEPYHPFGLSFFGVTNAPGTSFRIVYPPGNPPTVTCLPEPSRVAMWLAGVAALGLLRPRSR